MPAGHRTPDHVPTQRNAVPLWQRVRVGLVLGLIVLTGCQTTLSFRNARVDPSSELELARTEPAGELALEETPSVPAGRQVFVQNCRPCHGDQGFGDGPLADSLRAPHKDLYTDFLRLFGITPNLPDLPSRPANFHNFEAMRLNTPVSMYETITRGRPHTAMPAFGPRAAYGANRGGRLDSQRIWHVLFYEWSLQTTPERLASGQRIYAQQCAACHGPSGDGDGPQAGFIKARLWDWARGRGPGIFTDFGWMAQRNPALEHQAIFAGPIDWDRLFPDRAGQHTFRGRLTDQQIWDVVDYLWTFVYENPQATR